MSRLAAPGNIGWGNTVVLIKPGGDGLLHIRAPSIERR
jgi:hypothetical protein